MTLSRIGDGDLTLATGSGESMTLQGWYWGNDGSGVDLQVIAEALADFDANSSDPLLNQKVQQFNFGAIVNEFNMAGAPDAWAVSNGLPDAHLGGSDTEAIGGDLAYRYGLTGSNAGISMTAAQGILADPGFGTAPQALQSLAVLQDGLVKLS